VAAAAEDKKAEAEPKTDQEFLARALACDMAEIKMGEMAQKMATSPDVQRFAQKMVADHAKNRAALTALAATLKAEVSEAAHKDHKEAMEKLSKFDKKDFDREYVKCQVEGHEKALKMYEKWAKEAKDDDLRAAAAKAVPVVRGHLEEARRLATSLGTKNPEK
jgi:putative membrane protein